MTEKEYVILLGGSFKPLRARFIELGGFYNGVGYVFPKEKEGVIREIVADLPGANFVSVPLEGRSFEEVRECSKMAFLRSKLYGLDRHIRSLIPSNSVSVEELSREHIESSDLKDFQKIELLELLHERQKILKGISWHQGMVQALSAKNIEALEVKFLNEHHAVHYLLDTPPDMPSLVTRLDGNFKEISFIPRGILGMIVSAGGVGKTHILTQLGIVVATGGKWLGEFSVGEPGNVFMGLGENSDEDIHRLLRKTAKSLCLSAEDAIHAESRLSVMSFLGKSSSFIHKNSPTELFRNLLEALKEKEPSDGWSLIILDPISRFSGASAEIDNASATEFIALLEKLPLELCGRPTVLFAHHMNKTGVGNPSTDQGASRGSSALTDGVRLQINLDRGERRENEPETVTLRVVKSNFTSIPCPMTLVKDAEGCLRKRPDKVVMRRNSTCVAYD